MYAPTSCIAASRFLPVAARWSGLVALVALLFCADLASAQENTRIGRGTMQRPSDMPRQPAPRPAPATPPANAPAAPAVDPITINHLLLFQRTNINPWTGGPAFIHHGELSLEVPNIDVHLPTTGITPFDLLADLLGLSLPKIGFAEIGGRLSGRAALRFGYNISGGDMDVLYPMRTELTIQPPSNLGFPLGQTNTIKTRFTPGLRDPFEPTLPLCRSGRDSDRLTTSTLRCQPAFQLAFKDPQLTANFPTASAYARFDYDLRAGITATAGILRALGRCMACYQDGFNISNKGNFEVIHLSPGRVKVHDLIDVDITNKPINIANVAGLTFDYPAVKVHAPYRPANGTSLVGGDARPIIRIDGQIEKVIPFIGTLLRNDLGPIGYSLLETNAGPIVSLRQQLSLRNIEPRVKLTFSARVQHYRDGRWLETDEIEQPIGTDIQWRPLHYGNGSLSIQPSYSMHATFTNDTALALGYNVDVKGLRVTAGPAELGPVNVAMLRDNAAVSLVKICCDPVSLDFQVPPVPSFEVALTYPGVTDRVADLASARVHQRSPSAGSTESNLASSIGSERRAAVVLDPPASSQRDIATANLGSMRLQDIRYLQNARGERLHISAISDVVQDYACRRSDPRCAAAMDPRPFTRSAIAASVLSTGRVDLSTEYPDPDE